MGLFDAFDSGGEEQAEAGRFRALKKGFRQGKDLVMDYGDRERGQYQTAMPEIYSFFDKGVDQAAPYLQASREPYQKLFDTGMDNIDRYGDSLWGLLNDPDSVYDSELYKSREAAGLDAINRGYASRGMLASGNNTQDQIDYMRQGGLDYHKYLTGTMMQAQSPYFGMAQGGAAGLAGANTQLANLYNQRGVNKGQTAQWGRGNVADSYAGEGSALTNLALAKAGAKGNMIINNQTHQNNADANMWKAIFEGGTGLIGMV